MPAKFSSYIKRKGEWSRHRRAVHRCRPTSEQAHVLPTYDVGVSTACDVGVSTACDVSINTASDVGVSTAYDVGVSTACDVGVRRVGVSVRRPREKHRRSRSSDCLRIRSSNHARVSFSQA